RRKAPSVLTSSVKIATRKVPVPDRAASWTDGVSLFHAAEGSRARSSNRCIAGSIDGLAAEGARSAAESAGAAGRTFVAAFGEPATATNRIAAIMKMVSEMAHARRTNESMNVPPAGRRSSSYPARVPPPIARPTRPRIGRTRYKHSAPPTEVSQGETRPPDRPGDDHRAALGREVFHRDLAHAVLFQPADDLRIPLEEPHAEPVVLHAMELRRDLRVPSEAAVQPYPAEQEAGQVQRVVVVVAPRDRGAADDDVRLGFVRHRDRDPARLVRTGRRDRGDAFRGSVEAGERFGDRVLHEPT